VSYWLINVFKLTFLIPLIHYCMFLISFVLYGVKEKSALSCTGSLAGGLSVPAPFYKNTPSAPAAEGVLPGEVKLTSATSLWINAPWTTLTHGAWIFNLAAAEILLK